MANVDAIFQAPNRDEVRQALLTTQYLFEHSVSGYPADELEQRPICGIWSARDVVGHLADWNREVLAGVASLTGAALPSHHPICNEEQFNQEHAARRMQQPFADAMVDFDTCLVAGMALLASLTEDQLTIDASFPWDDRGPVAELLLNLADHGLTDHLGDFGLLGDADAREQAAAERSTTVHLRPTTRADIPVHFHYQSDPVAAAMAGAPVLNLDDFVAYCRRNLANPTVVQRTICDGDLIVGSIAAWADGGERYLSYWVGRPFWSRGIATQALQQFLEVDTARPLFATTQPGNAVSQHVLTKCGFRQLPSEDGDALFVLDR